jgi:hypothetical protein
MIDAPNDMLARIAALEGRVDELEAVQRLLLRLLSTTRPLARLLEYYGATKKQEEALYQFLDSLVERVRGPERDQPSFAFFEMHLNEMFPNLHDNREFEKLVIDVLSVERAAYRELHHYMMTHEWPPGGG